MHLGRDIIEVAFHASGGPAFERFCQAFFADVFGDRYIPLGGMHDGGADGVVLQYASEVGSRPTHFFQASIEQNPRAKIKKTIKALQKAGRDVQVLTYATSQVVPMIDKLEEEFLRDHAVTVRIRDREFLISHINGSPRRQAAFNENLGQYTTHLKGPGVAPLPTQSNFMSDPTVFVFLRQEADKEEYDSFVDAVTDSLCLWALQGTDPDAGILRTAEEVRCKILEIIPSADSMVSIGRINSRLQSLSKKSGSHPRRVRWHRKEDRFALPFSTRSVIADRNAEDETLRRKVEEALAERAARYITNGLNAKSVGLVALVALQKTFETRGLQFANFLEQGETSPTLPDLDEPVRNAVDAAGVAPAIAADMFIAALATVRDCLYQGSDLEREYLRRLARTYAMLFVLRQDPQVVRYLQEMSSQFYLYVGTDMLIIAMSERYLPSANQSATNLLLMARDAGAKLVLTEPVLDEVVTHLRAADREFENHYRRIEKSVPPELYGEIPRIMIRAYFYNRESKVGPRNWQQFLDNFCDPREIHRPSAEADIRTYLQAKFGMEYESLAVLNTITKANDVSDLTRALMASKTKYELARNDAIMVHAVYGRREASGEDSKATVFGYQTWWLTTETRVLLHTRSVVNSHSGARYMMRPDFLLNFFSLAPSMSEVRRTYQSLFPSALGLELSRRMSKQAVSEILEELKLAEDYDEPRRLAVMSRCADEIKSDFRRRHLQTLSPGRLEGVSNEEAESVSNGIDQELEDLP